MTKKQETVHLHWSWKIRPPLVAVNVAKAIGACGARDLKKGEWTKHADDTTCEKCLEIVRRMPAPDPEPAAAPPPRDKKQERAVDLRPEGVIRVVKERQEFKGAKAKRWDIIRHEYNGKTVAEYQKDGHNMEALVNRVRDGKVEIR